MWHISTREDAESKSQFPPTRSPTHILYPWKRDVKVGNTEILLALNIVAPMQHYSEHNYLLRKALIARLVLICGSAVAFFEWVLWNDGGFI